MNKDLEFLTRVIDEKSAKILDANDKIWEYAELAFHETKSAALLKSILKEEGFALTEGDAGARMRRAVPLHLRKSVPELTEPYNIYWFLICITLFSGRRSPLSDRFLFVFLKYIVSATDFMLYSKDVKLQKLSGAFSGFTA